MMRELIRGTALLASAGLVMLAGPTSIGQARTVHPVRHTVTRALDSGTLVLRGSMTSTANVSMTGAFSVGNAANLRWDLPRVTTVRENGYTETLDVQAFTFDVQPDLYRNLIVNSQAVRRFFWQNPPAQTVIHVTETFHATVRADLSPFHSAATYPVNHVSAEASPYLQATPLVRLPAGVRSFVNRFKTGKRSEQAVVSSVVNWVASHTTYDGRLIGARDVSAPQVLASHRANCRGYANIDGAILRALGIPVRVEFGWVSSGQIHLPGPHNGWSSIQWGAAGTAGETHVWISVYFPDAGWVALDPQREKFFVDSHHFAFFSQLEAGTPTAGAWTANYGDGDSPTGPPLVNGSVESVPGDGVSSSVTLHTSDTVQASFQHMTHDVQGVLLFSR